jgi:hypothetical protein
MPRIKTNPDKFDRLSALSTIGWMRYTSGFARAARPLEAAGMWRGKSERQVVVVKHNMDDRFKDHRSPISGTALLFRLLTLSGYFYSRSFTNELYILSRASRASSSPQRRFFMRRFRASRFRTPGPLSGRTMAVSKSTMPSTKYSVDTEVSVNYVHTATNPHRQQLHLLD